MITYTYSRWSGKVVTVEADRVNFEASGHVTFWDTNGLVLAERGEEVNSLRTVPEEDQ